MLLTGKFHSHLTIQAECLEEAQKAARLVSGKLTVIDLSRSERSQTDWMITHHYKTGHRGLRDQRDILWLLQSRAGELESAGYRVLRQKLEHENPCDHVGLYDEAHIKCLVDPAARDALVQVAETLQWHPSRNPRARAKEGKLVQFVNRRFYGTPRTSINALVAELCRSMHPFCEILEVKHERVLLDTNADLDGWWLDKS